MQPSRQLKPITKTKEKAQILDFDVINSRRVAFLYDKAITISSGKYFTRYQHRFKNSEVSAVHLVPSSKYVMIQFRTVDMNQTNVKMFNLEYLSAKFIFCWRSKISKLDFFKDRKHFVAWSKDNHLLIFETPSTKGWPEDHYNIKIWPKTRLKGFNLGYVIEKRLFCFGGLRKVQDHLRLTFYNLESCHDGYVFDMTLRCKDMRQSKVSGDLSFLMIQDYHKKLNFFELMEGKTVREWNEKLYMEKIEEFETDSTGRFLITFGASKLKIYDLMNDFTKFRIFDLASNFGVKLLSVSSSLIFAISNDALYRIEDIKNEGFSQK